MKKALAIVFCLIAAGIFSGCSEDEYKCSNTDLACMIKCDADCQEANIHGGELDGYELDEEGYKACAKTCAPGDARIN